MQIVTALNQRVTERARVIGFSPFPGRGREVQGAERTEPHDTGFFISAVAFHVRYVGGMVEQAPYTSKPEGARWAKARAGWYVERLRACALFASKSGQRDATTWLRQAYESGLRFTTVRLRFAQTFTIKHT